ncbi:MULTISPECIES: hypothetical protein [unclassified Streptomyces]|uniref:hypothetical protein n=1 Tax=unclassified Streptomyces TaxID=2593676 RepID=UPI00081F6499|nr:MULTISPECIES: hypothetical protein [unclassified Streptomyces]MYZ35855.1 hypothetical protein [Streptomyces sp. SID4917]SCF78862.1 hypothetical protein GA0115259_1025510 [Streptomyces sp. MnatMP-M17]
MSTPDPTAPTVYELIRTQGLQLNNLAQVVASLEAKIVTQEQRATDLQLTGQRIERVELDIKAERERGLTNRRIAWTSFGAPLAVAFLLWALGAFSLSNGGA